MSDPQLIPVSVYIITLNEAEKLPGLLSQLAAFSEVVIVDCGSTDRTAEIARKFANVNFSFRAWTGYSEQKAYALSLCSNAWVLNLDADEELTPEYVQEILNTLNDGESVAMESPRILYRWGRRSNNFSRGNRLVRLFRKDCGYYEARRVHERITVRGKIRRTSAPLIHHQNMNITEAIEKLNKYSQLKALDKHDKGSYFSTFIMLLIFPVTFLQHYLLRGFFLDGQDGLISSVNIAYYHFMKYAKLWELEHHKVTELMQLDPATRSEHH